MLEQFWGPFWGPNPLKKGSQNWTSFGTLLLRISEVQGARFCELNGSGEIAIAIGIILAKRKGGILWYSGVFPSLFGYSFSGSRLFSGSRALSRKKPATMRQQQQQPTGRATNSQQPVAICAAGVAKRVDPAALPLGSLRSRTQTTFSR